MRQTTARAASRRVDALYWERSPSAIGGLMRHLALLVLFAPAVALRTTWRTERRRLLLSVNRWRHPGRRRSATGHRCSPGRRRMRSRCIAASRSRPTSGSGFVRASAEAYPSTPMLHARGRRHRRRWLAHAARRVDGPGLGRRGHELEHHLERHRRGRIRRADVAVLDRSALLDRRWPRDRDGPRGQWMQWHRQSVRLQRLRPRLPRRLLVRGHRAHVQRLGRDHARVLRCG